MCYSRVVSHINFASIKVLSRNSHNVAYLYIYVFIMNRINCISIVNLLVILYDLLKFIIIFQ
jgi:hypothetical protein